MSKPITDNMKQRANTLFLYLKRNGGYVSKERLMIVLDVSNERSVRDVISTLAKRVPIIATSDNKGYKLAQTKEDLEEVEHMWKDLDSRQEELEARKRPLIEFYEKMTKESDK